MRGRRPPPGINEEIARLLEQGMSQNNIRRTLKVGLLRIRAVNRGDMTYGENPDDAVVEQTPAEVNAAALRSLGLPADWSPDAKAAQPDEDIEEEDSEPGDVVTVSADYLRALEALLFVTEQNRALRAALEAA